MKKLLLISFFKSNNIGDLALSKRLVDAYKNEFEVDCMDFCSFERTDPDISAKISFDMTRSRATSFKHKICALKNNVGLKVRSAWKNRLKTEISEHDLVCLAGGNMIMDICIPSDFTYRCYMIAKICAESNKKLIISHVGVGPFRTHKQKILARETIKEATFVSVRDSLSFKFVKEIKQDAVLSCDPVCICDKKHMATESDYFNAVGINVFFGYDIDRNEVRENYIKLIVTIRRKLPETNIYLFLTESVDNSDLEDLSARIGDKKVLIRLCLSYEELCDLYDECKMIIAARMHSGIIAYSKSIPVVLLCWQNKIKGLATDLHLEDRIYPIERFGDHADEIVGLIIRAISSGDKGNARNTEEIPAIFQKGIYSELK